MARHQFPELETMRRLRDEGKSYCEIGAAVGITERTAHRLLTDPDHRPAERTVIKIRRALEARRTQTKVPSRRGADSRAAS